MLIVAQQLAEWDRVVGSLAGAVVTSVVALIIWWLNRKRPSKVLVQELDVTSLVRIAKTVSPRIITTLDGKPVAQLSQMELSISNETADTIKQIVLSFEFRESTEVLECELSTRDATQSIKERNRLQIDIPFLNSRRHHGERVVAQIICDGSVRDCKISGRGEGWSAIHRTVQDRWLRRNIFDGAMLTLSAIVGVAYMGVASAIFGIDTNETDWRTYFAVVPPILLILIAGWFIIKSSVKDIIRTVRKY